MNEKLSQRCVHCIVSGRVQGVFYRASTQKHARELGITGWVRNCPNGDVELVACGELRVIEQLIEWLYKGPPTAKVANVFVEEYGNESFEDFLII